MAQVLLLPGLLGSRLFVRTNQPLGDITYWPPGWNTARGALLELQLDADGVLPGPLTGGQIMEVGDPVAAYYGPLSDVIFRAGHAVHSQGYDWRKSVPLAAQRVYRELREVYPAGPVVIVAHSMGGLMAKALVAVAKSHGLTTYISRIIYLGTPQYGSWETFRTFHFLSDLYRRILAVQGWGLDAAVGTAGPDYLDAVLASWPSFYEILPYLRSGPLFESDPIQAGLIYHTDAYSRANKYVTQRRLNEAPDVQDSLAGQPAGVAGYLIRGVDYKTPRKLDPIQFPTKAGGYVYTQDGDLFVTEPEATIAGLDGTTFSVMHNDLPLAPAVQQWVVQLLHGT